jgi:peptide deformylase
VAVRPIRLFGDPVLRTPAEPVVDFDCRRHRDVVARGFDLHGEPVTVTGSDLLARCVQHETDHLDGILFVDRLDPETRRRALSEIREAPWAGTVRLSPHPTYGRAL